MKVAVEDISEAARVWQRQESDRRGESERGLEGGITESEG